MHNFGRFTKPGAQLIMRTTNVGHAQCADAAAPLASRTAAWEQLGGWSWQPPGFTPAYFGAARAGPDPYDWRAPPLHERKWLPRVRASTLARRFTVLNVSHVDLRADGHVSGAMRGHVDANKAAGGRDCLHYCLPGPSDSWAHALYVLLTQNARFAQPRV